MEPVRLPLSVPIESRDGSLTKDSITENFYFEASEDGSVSALKRPGLDFRISALGLGTGSFYYNGAEYTMANNDIGGNLVGTNFLLKGGDTIISGASAFNPGEYGLFRSYGIISGNGITWSSFFIPELGPIYSEPGWTGTSFLITPQVVGGVGTPGMGFRSENGIDWTGFPLLRDKIQFAKPVKIGSAVYMYGVSSAGDGSKLCYYRSLDDGLTWTFAETALTITTAFNANAIVSNGSVFTNGSYYTTNGTTWTLCTNGAYAEDVDWSGSYFVASNGGNTYRKSTNGITWTTFTNAPSTGFRSFDKVAALNDIIILVDFLSPDWFAVSTDAGASWTSFIPPAVFNGLTENPCSAVEVIDDTFYIMTRNANGTQTNIFKSTNGVDWTVRNIAVPFINYTPNIAILP